MRNYIYKILIAAVAFVLVFEFTIGRKFNQINEKTEIVFTKEGRKEMVISLKNEIKKAIEKENYLDEEERILINKFIEKIRNELKDSN
jgi:DNA integrity scanning protein DisA with diadenylate cyclase activity|tara:strand:+ start:1084 stop:1347 length:264 start_codon:yes stop_codon:yes gene_type:complete